MDEYLQMHDDPKDQALVKKMYQIISEVLPDAEVRLSYGLVGFYQPKQICFFGINKQHIGFYPTDKPIEHFKEEIAPYLSGKTTLKFPKDEAAIPVELIQKIAVWNLKN
ncbi:iron chaperone [Companilactobacillus muriivasis]|uniref:iron chaperone n=1 Tax=Companilactobacillus muriivasis TaxID=3081444 RepID=UPI0030C77B4D